MEVRTEHHKRRVETDARQRPFLRLDKDRKPIINHSHYVPAYYDDWLVITILGQETWIGISPLSG